MTNRTAFTRLYCFTILLPFLSGIAYAQSLAQKIQPLIDAHRGDTAVAIKHLTSGEAFGHRLHEPQATASLIKFPVMIAAYRCIEQGGVSLDQPITLRQSDKVPGSGILTSHFSDGSIIALRDAVRLMIAFSDNTATNLVLDAIGLPTTNAVMNELGMKETRINAKVYRRDTSIALERSERFGLGSTTADEMVRLLEWLHQGKLGSDIHRQAMLEHLAACDDRSKVRRNLPSDVKLFHKTGAVDRVRTDAGIMETGQGPVAYCILTEKNQDTSWGNENEGDLLCAQIGRAIYEHFKSTEKAGPPVNRSRIAIGSSGPLVRALQRTLNARSKVDRLTVDGEFGPGTLQAVKAFQQSVGLAPSGELTKETWTKLGPLVPELKEPPVPSVESRPTKAPRDSLDGPPHVTCNAWVVMDGVSGEILYERNASSRLDPASTTKMMTALLVVEHAASHPEVLDEIITFSSRADATNGSTSDLFAGERLSVRELLYGLMLPSGNDASVALAEYFGDRFRIDEDSPGGLAGFVAAMNRRANELHLAETTYMNPHGLTHADHKSSARALAKLARHALHLPFFAEIVSTRSHETIVESELGYSRVVQWSNTNKLLEIEGYDGVKTGTTDAAGACLVASSRSDDRHLIVVVLGSKSSEARYTDTRNLFRWVRTLR